MDESRRSFLKKAGLGAAMFTILPRHVFGKMGGDNNFVAPSDQLTKGIIGLGGIGRSRLHFTSDERCRLVAICDVDSNHMAKAQKLAGERFGETLQEYHDFRDLIHDPNVDSGLLGWPLTVRISGATGFAWKFFWTGKENLKPEPVPAELDYDFWLGPAPYKPYNSHRVHQTFRGYWDYDGGGLGDMGQHYIDPVQYILGKDDEFPIKVEVDAPQQHPDAIGIWKSITYTYERRLENLIKEE